ncbi:uncharacterized protein LOC131163372 [Malania oleifera]|uniref:uncharacterized protein LOC131163372 n=1 Tax=Malania oleifera TaxID=397392 RepID=UPI0025AEB3C3|nr:uncharacterized protein LOC131163372 [Malania oleifera]
MSQGQDHEANIDPIHPPTFTPINGQLSGPPLVILEGPPSSAATFIPAALIPKIGMPPTMMAVVGTGKITTKYHYDELEEWLKAIKGTHVSNSINPTDMYLVPKVVLPPKFKVPKFEKFDGTQCPHTHLRLYFQTMVAYFDDEKLTIHYFWSNLMGMAVRWYIHLDRLWIYTWGDLATAFVAQYQHVMEMALDWMTLLEMEKKPVETFREYTYQWRDMAVQVNPPVGDREAIYPFFSTLKDPYPRLFEGSDSL